MNEYADSDTDAVIEGPAKSYIPGLAVVTGGDPSTGTYQYQLRDRLGSVRDIRSQAKARLAEYTFEPYGDVWSASGLALNQGFTGHTWDAALGMYHTAFRHYSPGMARWMSRDPLGMVDGPNLYGYVGGDPVNGVDPLGLYIWKGKKGKPLSDCAQRQLQKYFDIDLSEINIIHGDVPWWGPSGTTGTGWSYDTVSVLGKGEWTTEDLALIAHELQHIVQVREAGKLTFLKNYVSENRYNKRKLKMNSDQAYDKILDEIDANAIESDVRKNLHDRYGDNEPCE